MEGQDNLLNIPAMYRTRTEGAQVSRALLLVGDIPVLRLLSKDDDSSSYPLRTNTEQRDGKRDSLQEERAVSKGNNNNEPLKNNGEVISNLNETRKDQSNEGWTQVMRKESKESRFKRNKQPLLQIHASKLRQQRKCFKCLQSGHIQAICKNPRRCLYCNKTGHIIRDCHSRTEGILRVSQRGNFDYKRKPSDPPPVPPPNSAVPTCNLTLNRTQKPSNIQHNVMAAPRDWLTMPMNEPVSLWQERPSTLDVYLTPRAELSPANLFLERSAFIFAGPGASDPSLNRRIAIAMGRQFQCDPNEFSVHLIDENFGDRLLIFPNELMAQTAIDHASFYIGNNVEIQLHPYSPQLQMIYSPLGGRARIRIYGLPLQHWNRFDMCTLVSGFGYPLRVAPYFNNGNYEYLTMLVACKKPGGIPLNLKLRVNPYKTTVRVEMEGWLTNQGPPPPPNGGNNGGGYRGRSPNREGRARYRQGRSSRSPVDQERRNRDEHRASRTQRM
ncbi:Gag polyprotein [Carex littledalei]|uniref:Gag polyprotein n=1 Tax=Carex littledalei TaxID=544730 RepID=A0A833VGL4_9POAL|nr:Gag polyprotein [Carex littledalei]